MNQECQKYQYRLGSILSKLTQVNEVLPGRVEDTLIGWGMSRFGNQTTQMHEWGATYTSTAWLCHYILADRLKAMSLFTTRMVSKMTIGLRTLSYLPRILTEGRLNVLTVERSLQ